MSSSERRIPPAIADIESIESLVVDIVDIAAGVVEELGKFGDTNERVVLDKCKILMNNAKDIQVNLQNVIEARVECKPYENNDFTAKKMAELSAKKADVVAQRLENMQNILKKIEVNPMDTS
eukprot:CAMPEP_0118929280 /NCGR_PEP_ID=MMETSP1169-20130426/6326_1 /TAXON_ID=36882 /ORGANISM="Pyramimonas obovata, Strain CCMP722" /LENGTH=121 /DNA_ID=CAMNT_0006871439 /DNA_START=270 /DNA_END=635 /DNA_ORIENTATION=-